MKCRWKNMKIYLRVLMNVPKNKTRKVNKIYKYLFYTFSHFKRPFYLVKSNEMVTLKYKHTSVILPPRSF